MASIGPLVHWRERERERENTIVHKCFQNRAVVQHVIIMGSLTFSTSHTYIVYMFSDGAKSIYYLLLLPLYIYIYIYIIREFDVVASHDDDDADADDVVVAVVVVCANQ